MRRAPRTQFSTAWSRASRKSILTRPRQSTGDTYAANPKGLEERIAALSAAADL
jgi:hypothetical protein